VYVRKRISQSQYYLRKMRRYKVPLFLLACVATFLVTFALMRLVTRPIATVAFKAPATPAGTSKANRQLQPVKYERVVYPYSVIPGGIRNKADLVTSVADDPVVGEHYTNFDLSQTKFIRSDEPQIVHVAYRLRNKVYWTAKTVKIPPGETLISDGKNVARTRCGNRIAALPQGPISPEEPPIETFDIPMIASGEPPKIEVSSMTDLEAKPVGPQIPNISVQPLLVDNLQYDTKRPLALFPRTSAVPEPGTLGLMASGLAVILAIKFARRK
jgi:hypothetical protein